MDLGGIYYILQAVVLRTFQNVLNGWLCDADSAVPRRRKVRYMKYSSKTGYLDSLRFLQGDPIVNEMHHTFMKRSYRVEWAKLQNESNYISPASSVE